MTILFSTTLFVSAWLLFSVQPMIAKQMLPDMGGTPLVWNTCLVFFQSILLGGYCYAHILSERVGLHWQRLVHLSLLSLPFLLFALLLSVSGHPLVASTEMRARLHDIDHPIAGLLIVLATEIGLPFFFLSSSTPLLQRWYCRKSTSPRDDPYFLYAASNLGSLVGLLGYPLIERYLGLTQQSWLWCSGYVLLFILTSACAFVFGKFSDMKPFFTPPDTRTNPPHTGFSDFPMVSISITRRLRWLALAAGPSSLLVSVTNVITTDVAAVPLIWIIPLAIYLLTFILAFGRRQWIPHQLILHYLPLALIIWAIPLLIGATEPASVLFVLHLTTFFIISLACHGELHLDRPPAERLTSFYLCLSGGGVVGSIMTAFLAPIVFDELFEYPIVMIGAFAVANWMSPSKRQPDAPPDEFGSISLRLTGDIVIALASGLYVLMVAIMLDTAGYSAARSLEDIEVRYLRGAAFALPLIVIAIWSNRTFRFILGLAIILLGAQISSISKQVIYHERTWYGVHRVTWDASHRFHQLVHGNTVHGRQRWPPSLEAPPSSYYHPTGPLRDVFEAQKERGTFHRIAIAGLGAGCVAYYARDVPEQHWTFFEIDPAVVRIASDPRFFTFLSDSFPEKSRMDMILGDARLKLAEAQDSIFDLMILDAFSSDSIPVHLLTQEALALYMRKLADRGLLVFQISNRHLDFRGLLASLARKHHEPLVCLGCDDLAGAQTPQEVLDGKMASQWVVMARHLSDLGPLARPEGRWRVLSSDRVTAWTDDYVDILAVWKHE